MGWVFNLLSYLFKHILSLIVIMKSKNKAEINKTNKNLVLMLLRYLFLLVLGSFILSPAFNKIMLILTIYPVNFLLNLFYESIVMSPLILVEKVSVELIPACLAISAYLLLVSLNLLVSMKPLKRILSLIFSVLLLLLCNVIRIFILTILIIKDVAYYDIIHKFVWYFLSTILVIGIWFLTAYLFKIKEIPVYSDLKQIRV